MSVAERISPTSVESSSWEEICQQHPNEWVCLLDIEEGPHDTIRSARLISHDRSMKQALAQMGVAQPGTVVMHTGGRPLRFPRIEMTDEIRDIVRHRR